ncbi:family of serine hydrolases 1 [Phialemonium atrogriseum]|uniref:Family of serine hydrolases 1 n=1 Tax=Phialemonium atrogriseum TaxID=1093897 RepID=A0AAJ0C9T8_9PEZI|nr:family of serine hydrolases 1 [Phialemonium atrogriseum]KAK1771337.1 family of serine hydrolases 1 [Phialemonium atrogriseum]
MKILCLHGQGSSASVFKSQTAAIRAKLDRSTYTFDFVDAPYPCPPAPGINVMFESGHYAWYPKQTAPLIRSAHKWLVDYAEEHGPYDAVCCFSQGCALVMSFLLYHARETPREPLPFKSAIFICGGVPFPVLEDLGLPVPQRARDINDETVRVLKEKAGRLVQMAANPDQIQRGVGLWDDSAGLLHDPTVMPSMSDVFGLDFTAFPEDVRIKIPTVHIYGAKDPRWPASLQLAFFCKYRRMYDHGGGHDIPRSSEVSNAIAELIKRLNADS